MWIGRSAFLFVLGASVCCAPPGILPAQQAAPVPSASQTQAEPAATLQQAEPAATQDQEQTDPLKRQRSDKERYTAQKALRQELKGTYKTWLNDEVPYIITDEERKAFMNLSNDEERDAFIKLLAEEKPESGFA